MEKHIALLFLSIFQTDKKEIKDAKTDKNIEIFKLKSQNDYYGKGDFAVQGRHTNEPAVYYLLEKYQQLDKLFIFASDKVRSKLEYVDDQNIEHNQESHLQLFKDTIADKYALMKGKKIPENIFAVVNYDEPVIADKEDFKNWSYDSNNADFASILEMATKVKAYCDQVKHVEGEDLEIHLHVDMTGGFRHANMLMLAVVDLLKYSGLKVDDVIYTNFDPKKRVGKIEEVTNIHNVFQLVAGAEEFVRYGSVEALQHYFTDLQPSLELKALLQSMKNFADVLRLCRAGMVKNAIDDLKESIISYKKNVINDLEKVVSEEEKIFGELLATIEKKYAPVFVDNNEINIISWCMENGFTQQALTFFTELVPQTIFDNKILYTDNEKIIEKCDEDRADYVPLAKHFILNYNPPKIVYTPNKEGMEEGTEDFTTPQGIVAAFKKIYKAENALSKPNLVKNFIECAPTEVSNNFRKIEAELKNNSYARMTLKSMGGLAKIRKEYPYLYQAAYFTYCVNANNPSNGDFADKWMSRINNDKILKYFATISYANACALLKLEGSGLDNGSMEKTPKKRRKLFAKSSDRRNQILKLLQENRIKTDFADEAAADRVYDYYKICELRNMVNHANAEEKIENADIVSEINKAILNLNTMLAK